MSDTTKINKARVNGVLYDLGGSGGTGGVSGAWLAPGELIESGYVDSGEYWSYMTIDPEALVNQLEKAGVDVDETPFMDDNEHAISITIGQYFPSSTNNSFKLIWMNMSSSGMTMSMVDGSESFTNVSPKSSSLRQIIYDFFTNVTDLCCPVPQRSGNFTALANYILITYYGVNTTLRYYIPDMSEFCDEVFVQYTPSSE